MCLILFEAYMSVQSRNSHSSGVSDCMLSLAVLSNCCVASYCCSFLAPADKDDDDDDDDGDEYDWRSANSKSPNRWRSSNC